MTALPTIAGEKFKHIAFYNGETLIAEAENIASFSYDVSLSETSTLICKATVLGVEYERQQVVTHYNSFWLGSGSDYQSIMDVEHTIPISNGMRGAYNVDVAEGDRLFIVIGESLRSGFIRADLNGVEIKFSETTVTIDGKNYCVLSTEPWANGTYNIDING